MKRKRRAAELDNLGGASLKRPLSSNAAISNVGKGGQIGKAQGVSKGGRKAEKGIAGNGQHRVEEKRVKTERQQGLRVEGGKSGREEEGVSGGKEDGPTAQRKKRRKESRLRSLGNELAIQIGTRASTSLQSKVGMEEKAEPHGVSKDAAKRKKKKKKRKGNPAEVSAATTSEEAKSVGKEARTEKRGNEKKGSEKGPCDGKSYSGLAGQSVSTDGDKALQKAAPRQSSLLEKMRARLQGGHFRMLNERLYTSRGGDAFAAFQKDPTQFQHYHRGYQEQMSHWPKLPVEVVGEWLRARAPTLKVADFGCGDARLAASVKNQVFSLDLVAARPGVIACNMAHTPLESSSVDVAVFCLSLMGTDYGSFLEEAYRVLSPGGSLLIAEVKSRFDPQNGGADPRAFVGALKRLGFQTVRQDDSNKMFMWWEFRKGGERKGGGVAWPALKACIYKRR